MATAAFAEAVKVFAEEVGAIVWDGIPTGGAVAVWSQLDVTSFFNKVRRLAPTVVYLSPDSNTVAVAVAGVVHVYDEDAATETLRRGFDAVRAEPADEVEDVYNEDDADGPLSPELQKLAERIAADERFDGFGGPVSQRLIDESGIDVDPLSAHRVEEEAQGIFEKAIGVQLAKESRVVVRAVLEHPDFDPLVDTFWRDERHPYVEEALEGRDPRLRRLVLQGIQYDISELGLDDKAERELREEAARLRGTISQLVLDQVGFASRRAARASLLEPFLESVPEKRRELVGEWIQRLEGDRAHARREARYAVAAQRLWVGVTTKKSVAARLQVSTNTLDRLLGLRVPAGFEFDPDDPVVTVLAPELRER